ncbi:MAG: NusA-like transcription termination signal-binding factor [Candidatus Aenigmarchaeota archaeon]|nr:NusA-like transcription termination signal-binding factor [Candidatus Aenigmarchaeota archaeon]
MPLTLDTETIRLINLFENITGATVRDCIVEEGIVYYVVDEGKIRIAIGKNGSAIKSAEKIIGKKIKVFEFDKDPVKFVKKMIPKTIDVELKVNDNKRIIFVKVPKKDKPFVIGRNGRNIKIYRKILERNHKIDDIKVR